MYQLTYSGKLSPRHVKQVYYELLERGARDQFIGEPFLDRQVAWGQAGEEILQ